MDEASVKRVASAVAQALVGCGVIRKPGDDPWVVGPSILIARAAIRAMESKPRSDDPKPQGFSAQAQSSQSNKPL